MKKQNFLLGTIFLICSSFLAKIIGAIYRIPLSNILGTEGLGLYQLVFPLYSTILVFCSTGIPNAIAKMISQNPNASKKIAKLSLIFISLLSIFFTLLLILLSKQIATIQGNTNAWLCYVGIAPAIFFVGLLSVFRGYFQGKQNMIPTSKSSIIEQIFKLVFGLFFAKLFLRYGIMYSAFGGVLGVTLSEAIALIVIGVDYLNSKEKNNNIQQDVNVKFKTILKNTIPMTLSSMLMPATLLVDSFLIINLLKSINFTTEYATSLYGLLTGIVNSLINLPVVISLSVATMLIPIISKLFKNKNEFELTKKCGTAFHLIFLISIPCLTIFLFFSNEVLNFLFTFIGFNSIEEEFQTAKQMLRFASIEIIFISIVQITTSILQSIDETKQPIYNMLVSCSLKILLSVVLIIVPKINILGAVLSSLVCYVFCAILNLLYLRKKIKLTFSLKYDFLTPIISSTMMLTTMRLIKHLMNESVLVFPTMILVGVVIFLLVYSLLSYGEKYNFEDIISFFKKKKVEN